MEGEKILLAAGVSAAVVTAAFVFWGPTSLYLLNDNHENGYFKHFSTDFCAKFIQNFVRFFCIKVHLV